MKNKKLISRVLAIFAVLVLMVSMALPAFADEGIDSNLAAWEEFYNVYNIQYGNLAFYEMYANDFYGAHIVDYTDFYLFSFAPYDNLNVYGALSSYYDNDVQYSVSYSVGHGYGEIVVIADGTPTHLEFVDFEVEILSDYSLSFYFYNSNGSIVLYVYYTYDLEYYVLVFDEIGNGIGESFYSVERIDVAFAVVDDTLVLADDVVRTLTDDVYYRLSPKSFYDGVYLSNRPDGVVPPARTGMFGQIYYILYDAIYGSDAVIGTSQDFVLTQIATWMTYIVILLPLLVVAIFLWRVFAR